MVGAEIGQEVAGRATVLTSRVGSQRGAERIDGPSEQVGQGMLKGSTARKVHDGITGIGRMCWATARAYCW